jgi:hypothetical protein
MNYLTPEAAEGYYDLSRKAYNRGLISLTPVLVRLHALRSMCAPDDSICEVLEPILQPHDFTIYDEWRDGDEISKEHLSGGRGEIQESVIENQMDTRGIFMPKLIPAASIGLADWVFHQADPDFFPSIPHGHFRGKAQPKLDAYHGWTYTWEKQTGREPRKNIIALWNDGKFRDFASVAISYYSRAFPHHHWPVPNPLRLPRRRLRWR